MNALKAAIANKRKATQDLQKKKGKKYFRNRDKNRDDSSSSSSSSSSGSSSDDDSSDSSASTSETRNNIFNAKSSSTSTSRKLESNKIEAEPEGKPPLPVTAVIRALREMHEPATLFGETPWRRFRRYKKLENTKRLDGTSLGARDDFGKTLRELNEDDANLENADVGTSAVRKGADGLSAAERAAAQYAIAAAAEELEELNSKPESELTSNDKCKLIRLVFEKLIREWEEDLSQRTDAERKSMQGKIATATFVQCQEHAKPLFKQLSTGELHDEIREHLYRITVCVQEKEYVKAHDAYILLAIGNAAWPMGVTMVGIHERAGRSKIFDTKTAHILNDETQRKYIQSVKRLMTFAQQRYPTKPSKMVQF